MSGSVALETRSPIGDAPGVLSRLPSQLVAFACALACRAGLQDPPVASESPPTPISPPVAAPAADAVAPFASDPAKVCDSCDAWNAPREPFRVFGNTYYVGTAGLSSVLVVGNRGAVLIDGGLSQSAALIAANVRKLGFRLEDIRVIVSSHAHYDHVGGIAALQRASGATVMASPDGKRALEGGQPTDDDPQVGFGPASTGFPAVREVQALSDRQAVRVGDVTLTAHFTPGHTPGGTSWSWRSCEGDNCRDVVYADSLTAISAPGFRYSDGPVAGGRIERFRSSIARITELPCDILLAPHPGFLNMDGKLEARRQAPQPNPFIDAGACAAYAARALKALDERIAEESTATSPSP
jgi:metallo-beta-lactamase class B